MDVILELAEGLIQRRAGFWILQIQPLRKVTLYEQLPPESANVTDVDDRVLNQLTLDGQRELIRKRSFQIADDSGIDLIAVCQGNRGESAFGKRGEGGDRRQVVVSRIAD